MKGRVLIVAGSDSGGGAGIQADIKTVTALGGYAATAITALTAQNTLGVHGVHGVPAEFVAAQMRVVLDDIGADAIKLGMLGTTAVIDAVADVIESAAPSLPLVLDPVMVAKGGAPLLDPDALAALKRRLVVRATVLTPNLPEAEALIGGATGNVRDRKRLAQSLLALGPEAVLLKGGHDSGPVVSDLLVTIDGEDEFEHERIDTRNTHGTGCTLASAIAVGLAQGLAIRAAIVRARTYLIEAIRRAPGLGRGHGPIDHGHVLDRVAGAAP